MSESPAVRYEVVDRVARITLNRPGRGNGITLPMIEELVRCVERADLDPAVHVLLLAGSGAGFCGGYDLVESAEGMAAAAGGDAAGERSGTPLDPRVVAANHDPARTWDAMVDYAMMSRNVRGFMSLFHCGKPVVCKVHGFCVAGGTDLALCADLLVIAEDAKIGYPPARVWRVMPSNTVPSICVVYRPWEYSVWLTSSFIIISWLRGIRAIRVSRTSVRSSRRSAAGASIARPHSTASRPERESPVNSSRFARWAPILCAQSAVVGDPHTRAGG